MKKILAGVLVVVMLVSCFSITSVAAVSEPTSYTAMQKAVLAMERADVNKDSQYSTDDAILLLKAAAGIVEPKEEHDVDADGAVSVSDAKRLLGVIAGVDSVVSKKDALEIFNQQINSVKSKRPGFNKVATVVCPSIKVTTSGAPMSSLNVTNMEYNQYVDKFVGVVEGLGSLAGDDIKDDLNAMKQSAVDVYKPQVTKKTVYATYNTHFTHFPVNNLGWASKLTVNDVQSVSCAVDGEKLVVTVNMDNYVYNGNDYPTGSSGFSKRQELPYGKAFNLPALDESDGSTVNKMEFRNGKITIEVDMATEEILTADYNYTYISSVTAAKEEGSNLVMKTTTTTNVNENYVMGVVEE